MSLSIKDKIQRLPSHLQTLPTKLVEVEKFTLTNLLVRNLHSQHIEIQQGL